MRWMFRRIRKNPKGVTLLFALLVINVALSVSLGVSNLVLGELQLSAAGRDSQIAFYAADAAVECALYWELVQAAFVGGVPINFADVAPTVEQTGTIWEFSFILPIAGSERGNACADVSVERTENNLIIRGLGHYPAVLADAQCAPAARTVQRGLEARFSI